MTDTTLAHVSENDYIPLNLPPKCKREMKENNLIDLTGRFRVEPNDKRIQDLLIKHNTTLFII